MSVAFLAARHSAFHCYNNHLSCLCSQLTNKLIGLIGCLIWRFWEINMGGWMDGWTCGLPAPKMSAIFPGPQTRYLLKTWSNITVWYADCSFIVYATFRPNYLRFCRARAYPWSMGNCRNFTRGQSLPSPLSFSHYFLIPLLLPFPSLPPFSPFLPSLNTGVRLWEHCKLPQRVWGEVPAATAI